MAKEITITVCATITRLAGGRRIPGYHIGECPYVDVQDTYSLPPVWLHDYLTEYEIENGMMDWPPDLNYWSA